MHPFRLITAAGILALQPYCLHGGSEGTAFRRETSALSRGASGLYADGRGLESNCAMVGPAVAPRDGDALCLRLRGGRSTALGQRLQNLQYVMKKDPEGYVPEVQGHLENWRVSLRAWERAPELVHQELGELGVFLCGSMNHFPSLLGGFGGQVLSLLERNSTNMHSELRMTMTRAIAIANSRKSISVNDMCSTFFQMFHFADKRLRNYLYTSCLSAIKRMNARTVHLDRNRALQGQLAGFLHGSDTRSGRAAILLMVELYRRGMWADAHMVNLIAAACFSRQSAVRLAALHFFLGVDDDIVHDEDEEADDFGINSKASSESGLKARIKIQQIKTSHNKRKKKQLRLAFGAQQKEDRKRRMGLEPTKKEKRKQKGGTGFSVLEHLHDPQAFAERMLASMKRWGTSLKFEQKLLMIELISRIMAEHSVMLLDFYDWMLRYLTPHQEELVRSRAKRSKKI